MARLIARHNDTKKKRDVTSIPAILSGRERRDGDLKKRGLYMNSVISECVGVLNT